MHRRRHPERRVLTYTAVEMSHVSGRLPAAGSWALPHPAERLRIPPRVLRPTADMAQCLGRPAPRPAAGAPVSAGMSPLTERPAAMAGRKIPIPAAPWELPPRSAPR